MITFDLVASNSRASGVFIEPKNVRLGVAGLITPRSIAAIGQYNDDKTTVVNNTPRLIASEGEEDVLYGPGSMLALSIKAIRQGSGNSMPIYALPVAPAGGAVKATGNIVIAGTATAAGSIPFYIGGQKVVLSVANGATGVSLTQALATLINATTQLPLVGNFSSPNCALTAKNAGTVGNQTPIAVNLETGDAIPAGLTVTITQMASGATDPDITNALNGLGNVWYTDIHSPYTDSTNLNALRDVYVARIAPDFKKPFVGFVPNNQAYASYLSTANGLNTEAITLVPNFQSNTLHYQVSGYVAGYASRWWQANPGRPIRGATIPIARVPNTFTNPTYNSKQALVLAGGTTLGVTPDNQFYVEDLCTTRKTNASGAAVEDLRFTEILSNIQTKIYSMDQVFSSEPFLTGVVVDDDSTSDLAFAIRPKFVKATLIKLIDDLWVPRGLTKNRDTVVASVIAEINSGNGGRIDTKVVDDLAAGLKIIAIAYNYGIGAGV